MKQKTSVYLEDLDREAVQQVGEYYGITSDTDVLCFSVRAVARTLPTTQKVGQGMAIPAQGDKDFFANKQWQVDIYTSKDQTTPHTFYSETMKKLQKIVYEWLLTAHPTYIRSKKTYEKEARSPYWQPFMVQDNELAYEEFCKRGLDIQRGPEYRDRGLVDGKFQLDCVKTTTKYQDGYTVNQLLERGWHILALDKSVNDGEETTHYVLGHAEEGAI